MAAHVTKRCPHCKYVYESTVDSRGIGMPVLKCPRCKELIIDKDQNEWELMDGGEKLFYIFVSTWTCVLLGGTFTMALFPLCLLFGIEMEPDVRDEVGMQAWGIGIVFFFFLFLYLTSRNIKKSKARMKDPHYRRLLTLVGLMEKQ